MSGSPSRGPARMSPRDALIGAGWAMAAGLLYAFLPIGVRLVSDDIPSIEVVFIRNVTGFVLFIAVFWWRGFGSLRTERFGLHLQRNIANFVGMWFWFAALAAMPLAKAVALHFTQPLLGVGLAVLFLGERPGVHRIAALGIGFVGILVILRPGAISIGWPALMVLGSALLYAAVNIYSRILGRTEAASTTTFYYQAMLTAFAFVPAAWVWVWPGLDDLPGLALVAVTGTLAPYCVIRAFRHAEATLIEPFGFLRLPFTATLAWLLFAEPTEIWTWVGAALIYFGAYVMTRGETRGRTKAKP